MKVALVHDWLVSRGGGERVLHDLHSMFPQAPIYTLVYDARKAPQWLLDCDVRTTYLQKLPEAKSHHQLLLPLMPRAWESLDLREFDLVISTCSCCCKGVITHPDSLHVCYCFSPTRYLWDMHHEYLGHASLPKRRMASVLMHQVRAWDYQAAQRPDFFVADSDFVGRRIRKYYGRESTTIYPGVQIREVARLGASGTGVRAKHGKAAASLNADGYYLVVSRMVHYKRIDHAIQACNQLGRVLVIVGSGGEEEANLRKIAGPGTVFAGRVPDARMTEVFSGARALLFPGVEDFGITPVEAMSCGVPVLAYGKGGARETVLDGKTGLFYDDHTPEGLAACIQRFESEGVTWTPKQLHDHAAGFSQEVFRQNMTAFLEEKLAARVRG